MLIIRNSLVSSSTTGHLNDPDDDDDSQDDSQDESQGEEEHADAAGTTTEEAVPDRPPVNLGQPRNGGQLDNHQTKIIC